MDGPAGLIDKLVTALTIIVYYSRPRIVHTTIVFWKIQLSNPYVKTLRTNYF